MVAEEPNRIDDKSVAEALDAVIGNAPDVRVFNMSFDQRPLPSMNDVDRRERLALVQDLDNQIFARDILVVVAAGNSRRGIMPDKEYPGHFDEMPWKLGPFTRSGPDVADAPVPEFAASGGECDRLWDYVTGMGVLGLNNDGQWEDRCGTSYAAPLLAREAAIAFPSYKHVSGAWGAQAAVDVVSDFGADGRHGWGPELRLGLLREVRREDYVMSLVALDLTAARLFGDHDGWVSDSAAVSDSSTRDSVN